MSTIIRAGVVVPATGGQIEGGGVLIEDGRIREVLDARGAAGPFDAPVIDARDCVLMPGLVNIHTHGVSPSPLFPSGAAAISDERWMAHLDRHLAHGTTTVLSACGLGLMAEIEEADRRHAVHVKAAAAQTPGALAAARAADGAGLGPEHLASTVEQMLEAGAVAVGELAGGQTLGGGGQDLVYLPAAILRSTGVVVDQRQARSLKESVLGRFMDDSDPRTGRLENVAREVGLGSVPVDDLRALILGTVMSSVGHARAGIREGVTLAQRLGVPALVHSASASAGVMRELMPATLGATIIAGHVNHTSHTVQEAVDLARAGRDAGWRAEASVFDLLQGRETVPTREHWDALLAEEGLVDVIATDYGHDGRHDPLIAGVQDIVSHGYRSLSAAVEMVTSVPAALIPGLVEFGATIRRGAPADLVLARRHDLRDVRAVYIAGQKVVADGVVLARAPR
jgi:imidazolonepropionase-like amidohydrolase